MNKYALKKDLPFAVKGTEVVLTEKISLDFGKTIWTSIQWVGSCGYLNTLWLNDKQLEDLVKLVKPKEFVLSFKKSDGKLYAVEDLTTKKQYIGLSEFDGTSINTIRVREVTE